MSQLTADLFVSLDGFARADSAGPYFDYGGPELDEWIQAELDKPQVVVLGRRTYQMFAPTTTDSADAASEQLTALPKIVVSSTLAEPLEWANTRLVHGNAVETLPPIKRQSEMPLRTVGSVSLVRSLMAAGILDRLRLLVFPLTCGDEGSERISEGSGLTRLQLEHTRTLDGRIVLLEYRFSA